MKARSKRRFMTCAHAYDYNAVLSFQKATVFFRFQQLSGAEKSTVHQDSASAPPPSIRTPVPTSGYSAPDSYHIRSPGLLAVLGDMPQQKVMIVADMVPLSSAFRMSL